MKANLTFKEIFDQYDRKFLNENCRQLEEDVDEIINKLWGLKRKIHHSKKDTRYDMDYLLQALHKIGEKCHNTSSEWSISSILYRSENVPKEIMDKYERVCNGEVDPEEFLIGGNEIKQSKPNQAKLFD